MLHGTFFLLSQLCAVGFAKTDPGFKLETIARWSHLEYDISSNHLHNNYIQEHNILGNVRHYDGSLYVTVPRWRDGVPSTLNSVSVAISMKAKRNEKKLSPKLKPFPNLAENAVGNCQALQNVAAIEIDPRGWLWIADSGTAAIFSAPNKRCKAKLLIYDLNSHTPLLYFNFPNSVVTPNSVLMHMALDFSPSHHRNNTPQIHISKHDGVFAYFADIIQGTVIVFDFVTKTSWKREAIQMRPISIPLNIAGDDIQMRHGITGIAIESDVQDRPRRVFFGTLTNELYALETWALQNSTLESDDVTDFVQEVGDRRDSCEAMTTDSDGNLYYGLLSQGSVVRWNSSTELNAKNSKVMIQEPKQLVWINSIFIDEGSVWVVANRFHAFTWFSLTFNAGDANFQIFRIPTHNGIINYMHEFVNGGKSVVASAFTIFGFAYTNLVWSNFYIN